MTLLQVGILMMIIRVIGWVSNVLTVKYICCKFLLYWLNVLVNLGAIYVTSFSYHWNFLLYWIVFVFLLQGPWGTISRRDTRTWAWIPRQFKSPVSIFICFRFLLFILRTRSTNTDRLYLSLNMKELVVPFRLFHLQSFLILCVLLTSILRTNYLSGAIPLEFGYLTKLEVLDLSGNNLTGAIPVEIIRMVSLKRLWVLCCHFFT